MDLVGWGQPKTTPLPYQDALLYLYQIDSSIVYDIPAISPVHIDAAPYITSKFGWRFHPLKRKWLFHKGIDIGTRQGFHYIYATANGLVQKTAYQKDGLGLYITLRHCFDTQTQYGHLNQIFVTIGQRVQCGEVIGMMGNTGNSTAKHLHYSIIKNGKEIDPSPFLYLYKNLSHYD